MQYPWFRWSNSNENFTLFSYRSSCSQQNASGCAVAYYFRLRNCDKAVRHNANQTRKHWVRLVYCWLPMIGWHAPAMRLYRLLLFWKSLTTWRCYPDRNSQCRLLFLLLLRRTKFAKHNYMLLCPSILVHFPKSFLRPILCSLGLRTLLWRLDSFECELFGDYNFYNMTLVVFVCSISIKYYLGDFCVCADYDCSIFASYLSSRSKACNLYFWCLFVCRMDVCYR